MNAIETIYVFLKAKFPNFGRNIVAAAVDKKARVRIK